MVDIDGHIRAERRPSDVALARLAARQDGVVARQQLNRLGYGDDAIAYRLRVGRLHRIHPRVYAVGHEALTYRARLRAALLAAGPTAAISHRSAVALWDLRPSSSPRVEITAPGTGRRPLRGVTLHRARSAHPDDRTEMDGLAVTSVEKTLLDFASLARDWEVERAFEQALRREALDMRKLYELLDRSPGRKGVRALRRVIAEHRAESIHTRHELERRFLDVCVDNSLPVPVFNASVEGLMVDSHWPGTKLVAELDSWQFHGGRLAFERDRDNSARLQLAGYDVIRITWRMLTREPARVAALVRRRLGPLTVRTRGSARETARSGPTAAL